MKKLREEGESKNTVKKGIFQFNVKFIFTNESLIPLSFFSRTHNKRLMNKKSTFSPSYNLHTFKSQPMRNYSLSTAGVCILLVNNFS